MVEESDRMIFKKIFLLVFIIILTFILGACSSDDGEQQKPEQEQAENNINNDWQKEETIMSTGDYKVNISANNHTLSAVMYDSSSSQALRQMLEVGSITVKMSDFSNFEKVGSLGTTLPRNDEQITTVPGDIILYQGSNLVIYYDTNSWNFTRLGKIENATKSGLLDILGSGNVTVTLSLAE